MAAKLPRNASGTAHLQWAAQILATIEAHLEENTQLRDEQRQALADEHERLQRAFDKLEAAVVPYRQFVERGLLKIAARQRVANYLCDDGQRRADGELRPYRHDLDSFLPGGFKGLFPMRLSDVLRAGHVRSAHLALQMGFRLESLPARIRPAAEIGAQLLAAGKRLQDLILERERLANKQQAPLRVAVERAVNELRETLRQMDGRLRSHFFQPFIDSLYPEINKRRSRAADDEPLPEDDGPVDEQDTGT